jgi:hypothetical protein
MPLKAPGTSADRWDARLGGHGRGHTMATKLKAVAEKATDPVLALVERAKSAWAEKDRIGEEGGDENGHYLNVVEPADISLLNVIPTTAEGLRAKAEYFARQLPPDDINEPRSVITSLADAERAFGRVDGITIVATLVRDATVLETGRAKLPPAAAAFIFQCDGIHTNMECALGALHRVYEGMTEHDPMGDVMYCALQVMRDAVNEMRGHWKEAWIANGGKV